MNDNTIQFGVIGAGRMGKIHAENLETRIPGTRVAAISDINLPAAQETANRLKIPLAIADYQAVLEDPEIDAIAICSSTDTHVRIIISAALAGKHIFCEKPIHHELALIDQALEAVERAGVKLQIGFNRRFDPNFMKIHAMVGEGKIGKPHILRITSRDPAPPPIEYIQVSGGIFLDMTIHDFDMARYLMGCEVEQIYVAGSTLVDPEISKAGDIDTALTVLHFENGAIGTIDNSRKAVYGYDQRVEVFGSEGMIAANNNAPDNDIYANADGIHSSKPLYFFLERYKESYIEEMRQFAACILSGTQPLVTGYDGRISVLMGIAAKRSYLEKRPIKVFG
jgi:myo-inositol 2-dehydrogenase / D-chiro-inositol 1-dehydrogenase